MRSYLVIPAGTPVLRVDASTPHFAASKARRGKAEHHEGDVVVVPLSAAVAAAERPLQIDGQLKFED